MKSDTPFKLKFPVLNNVEFIDILKNRTTLLSVDGKTVEGFTWRQFMAYVGEHLPVGVYHYSLKFNKSDDIYRGTIRAVNLKSKTTSLSMDSNEIVSVKKSIEDLNNKISNLKTDSPGMDLIISLTKQGYESQISFLRDEITRKEKIIEKYEKDVEKLQDELDEADAMVDDLKSKTGINQYIAIAKEFLTMKAGNAKPISSLKDSDISDIPAEILRVLGVVDWSKVEPSILDEIVHYLKIFIQKFPLKVSNEA